MAQTTLPTGAKVNIDDKGNILNSDNSVFTGGGSAVPVVNKNPATPSSQPVTSDGSIKYQSTNPSGLNYVPPTQIGDKSINPAPLATPLPNGGNTDPKYDQANKNIAPQTEEEFYAHIQGQLQPVLDKITEAEHAAETSANRKATQATSALNFGANSRGVAGSSEATSEAGDIESQRGADVAAALQTQADSMKAIANIDISAYQAAQTRNDINSQAYISQQQKVASNALQGLSSSGLTLSDLKNSNPVEYQQLLQFAGGDENALNALFVASSQANMIGDPVQIGNTLVYKMKTIDANGQPSIKTVDVALPPLPKSYKVTSYNQSANGTVTYLAFPTDSAGNQTVNPDLPNNGIISGVVGGGTNNSANIGTIPDPTSTAITANTGLSINAFNFLTQGTNALSRMNASSRAQVQSEAQDWANKNGIDLATFQSQFKANNDTLSANISRFNNTKVAEGEVTGTLSNLNSQAIQSGLGGVNIGNVAAILSGQQVNDPSANAYAFYFNDLKNSLAYFYAAQQGKASPDIIDNEDAANVIVGGLSNGGISGLQDAVGSTTAKMKTVLQNAVNDSQQNVWNLFGVGQNYQPKNSDGSVTTQVSSDTTSWGGLGD